MSDEPACPGSDDDDFLDSLDEAAQAEAVASGLHRLPEGEDAFDIMGTPLRVWQPSTTNEDDEDVLDILPEPPSEFAFQHLETKARVGELPDSLRHIVGKLRTDFLRFIALDWIEARIEHQAIEAGAHKQLVGWAGDLKTTWYVPAIWRRRILRSLAADPNFVRDLRALVTTTVEQAHEQRVWRSWPRPLPNRLPQTRLLASGAVTVESWVGFGTETLPETAPEGLLVLLARRMWRPHRGATVVRRKERTVGWALHVGAMGSTFTLALMATAPKGVRWDVCEVDVIGEPLSLPWVWWRSHEVPTKADVPKLEPFKVAFVHVPPPGLNGNQIRNRAKDLVAPPHEDAQRRLADPGRLGPRKWKRELRATLKKVIKSLHISGELFLLLPRAVRTTEIKNGHVEWRYQPEAGLLEGVRELLLEEGLAIEVDVEVVEKNPVRQPFFGFERCPWTLIIARRPRADEDVFEEDHDIEAILRDLEDVL
jgi:hypothetical protein